MVAATAIPERNWVNIQWLARLRWAQIAGQATTVVVGQFLLDGALPMAALFGVIAVGLVSNLVLELHYFGDRRRPSAEAGGTDGLGGEPGGLPRGFDRRGRDIPRPIHARQIALVMMLDIAVLTGLLYFTGGPHNPFAFLYVVQIALATVLVQASWTWMLVGLSFVGFGILLVAHQPLEIPDGRRVVGMWVALGVASAFVVYFLRRITVALAERDEELMAARGLAARQERLASLATMAAGAAHELSTPLGTVALAAKELERALTGTADPALAADARLIREQVGRCRVILEQMAQGAGTVGEGVAACTVGELIDEVMVGIRDVPAVHRDIPAELSRTPLRLPPRAVSQALRSLVTNAQDASPPTAAVVITARVAGTTLELVVRDRGAGMPREILDRIGEPFYTTKPPGRGMGLGLFLARAVVEAVGGSLQIDSTAGAGTEVRVALPTDVSQHEQATGRSRESPAAMVVSKPV